MSEKFVIGDFLKQAASLIPTNVAKVRSEFEENLRPLVEASRRPAPQPRCGPVLYNTSYIVNI